MSKGVFNWTAEEVVRFLKDRGFSLNHSRGSHLYYVGHANGFVQAGERSISWRESD